jgi:hypothetical protein
MESTIRNWNGCIKQEGLKSVIADRMGFNRDRIYLLESYERDNEVTWVTFEVNGQGYSWNIEHDRFMVNNAYGDRFFGEDE